MERRQLTRIPAIADTRIVYDAGSGQGEIHNISIGGVFIKTSEKISADSRVNVMMYLRGNQKPPIIMSGRVNRNDSDGIAVKFDDAREFGAKLYNSYK